MKQFVNRNFETKKIPFQDGELEISKLSVGAITRFQKRARAAEIKANLAKGEEDPEEALAMQRDLIRSSVEGAKELTDEELDSFPLDDIKFIVEEVLAFSGVKAEVTAEGNG